MKSGPIPFRFHLRDPIVGLRLSTITFVCTTETLVGTKIYIYACARLSLCVYIFRYLLASSTTSGESSKINRNYPLVIIVADQLKSGMCKLLPGIAWVTMVCQCFVKSFKCSMFERKSVMCFLSLPEDTIIEHHTSAETAFRRCCENDRILIQSGTYSIPSCVEFNHSVKVEGVGEPTGMFTMFDTVQ